ncbi:MAG TPA: hypothetical protein VGO68_09815 [Pyrinomonadaceae bacterium]|jgi:hypothetical protein|nr:hypothetical protein [Pyrinomonadaceae bacterium]
MNKIKSAAAIALAIFFAGIFATAAAQNAATPSIPHTLPLVFSLNGTYNVNVDAVEVSIGTVDDASGATYGITWSGKTNSDLSGYMFVSLNLAAPESSAEVGDVRAVPHPSVVTGGSWSKVVFVDGAYVGTVFGTVTGGQLVWDAKTQTSSVNLQLVSDRGADAFVGATGSGTFVGVVDQSGEVPTVTGTLTLEY